MTAVPLCFNLPGLISKIKDQLTEPYPLNIPTDVHRYIVAYCGGLMPEKQWKKLERKLVKAGVAKEDFVSLQSYVDSDEGEAAWKAYSVAAYYSSTATEVADHHGAAASNVQYMIEANALGLFTKWDRWPRGC